MTRDCFKRVYVDYCKCRAAADTKLDLRTREKVTLFINELALARDDEVFKPVSFHRTVIVKIHVVIALPSHGPCCDRAALSGSKF